MDWLLYPLIAGVFGFLAGMAHVRINAFLARRRRDANIKARITGRT